MAVDGALHDLILRIHRTATEGGAWIDVAAAIGERIGAYGTAAILHRADRPGILPSSALAGYRDLPFDEILREYGDHFHARNPQALFERARPDALHYLDGQDPVFTPENFPDFTRWERDRMGVRFHHTAYCRPGPGIVYGFTFPGSALTGPISGERLDLFFLLTEHLRQAVATAHRLSALDGNAAERSLDARLQALPHAAATLDRRGLVLSVNAAMAALALEGDGLHLGRAGLRFGTRAEQDTFHSLLSSVFRLLAGAASRGGGVVTASRPSGRRPFVVSVGPAPGPPDPGPGIVMAALVTVRDLDRSARLDPGLLMAVFGLTRAEARVAAALFEHGSLNRVSAATSTGIATLRSHLKQIFAKTSTVSQVELATVLARLA